MPDPMSIALNTGYCACAAWKTCRGPNAPGCAKNVFVARKAWVLELNPMELTDQAGSSKFVVWMMKYSLCGGTS